MKALIFRAIGEFARFRCPYTTTSALTYTIIHPIAIKGLIGAIMGIEYNDLYEYTKNMKIGIQVLKPVKKDTQSFNLIPQVKNNGSANFQTRVEFLRDVDYRIFITDEEKKLESIKNTLKSREYIFTPYLGASEHIAKLIYENIEEINDIDINLEVSTDTAIPRENFVIHNEETTIYLDRIPIENKKTREYSKYEKIVFTSNKKINTNSKKIKKVGEYNVYFF